MKCKLLILALLCCFFFASAQKKKNARQISNVQTESVGSIDYKQAGAPMPPIRLAAPVLSGPSSGKKNKQDTTLQIKVVTDEQLKNDANLLVMMFNPTCGHCEEQTDSFLHHLSLFNKSKLVLMAGANMLPYLDYFNQGRQIDAHATTIVMGVDSAQFIEKTFRYESLPQINIYDHDRKLIRWFNGPTSIDSLKAYIE